MSRENQYIGLNRFAENAVKNAQRVEVYQMTEGMFGKPVYGKIYYLPPPSGPNKYLIAKEVVQVTSWSGGMMIFTCLEMVLVKECGQRLEAGKSHEWMYDWTLEVEVDIESGRYNV